ncbi:hypothetical protein [Sinorhizobium meliloti]|uniref:hypothetical protein n=1 Tax=Rhizobium meliloti TaxID=382 RepID=UPI000FD89262|nr:hypothetical protein [Sinorhizobium meliloti]RVG89010.1 hypothetical protein CN218_26000 [Sinorhizobium meliloti]RVK90474.1 hypothetical protein CN150_27740 [Sinorhizobium meliloti]RVL60709.1 hypothetical protein CN137_18075 [Sinorhizobium meliloti]
MAEWQNISEENAIEAAITEHGKDATMSVAYCAVEAYDGRENDEYRFWFGLFLKLAKRERVGWA